MAYGIGSIGDGPRNSVNSRRAHGVWTGMLSACSDPGSAKSICGDWLDFQSFAAWYEEHCYDKSLKLDLNIGLSGSDCYGPDTCVLIPRELTGSVPKRQVRPRLAQRLCRGRGKETLPQGVYGAGGGLYAARVSSGGSVSVLGPFGTPEEARGAYLRAKADALEEHAARIDGIMSDDGRAAVARCCARLRDEAV